MAKKMPPVNYYSQIDRMGNSGVLMEWGALTGQLAPAEARTLGLGLIAASIEAECDAASLLFLRDGGSDPKLAEEVVENMARKRRALRKSRLAIGEEGEADFPKGV